MSGVYGWSYGSGGVHYYRMAEPLRVAREHGIWTDTGKILHDGIINNPADTILAHMLWDESASEGWQKLARNAPVRLVLDIDDAMWVPDWKPFANHYTPDVLSRVIENIRVAHVVTTTTDYIADWVSQFNDNVHVVPNTIPEWLTRHVMPIPFKRYPRIGEARYFLGYQGSPSHEADITDNFQQSLWKFIGDKQQWGIQFYGEHWKEAKLNEYPFTKVRVHPWEATVEKYLRGLSFDVGLGPLKDSPFNKGKSALRVLEFSALGVPSVVSNRTTYHGYAIPGRNAFLVDDGQDWYPYLAFLADEPEVRIRMGETARTMAMKWTTEQNINRWVEAWSSA